MANGNLRNKAAAKVSGSSTGSAARTQAKKRASNGGTSFKTYNAELETEEPEAVPTPSFNSQDNPPSMVPKGLHWINSLATIPALRRRREGGQ